MALRRRKLSEIRLLEREDTRDTDTCDLEDQIYCEYPRQEKFALTGRDFKYAEDAIEKGSQSRGTFHVYKWGPMFVDRDGHVDIWSHGRLLVSIRRLDGGDGIIMIGTTDIKNILAAINEKENFRAEENKAKRLPIFSGDMTYLGPKNCDVRLGWVVWLNECYDRSGTCTSRGDMSEIIVRQR